MLRHVGFTDGREPQQPQDAVRNGFEDVQPHVQTRRINLVQLVEVTVDNGVLGKAVLLPRAHYDGLLNLFTCRCLRVCL